MSVSENIAFAVKALEHAGHSNQVCPEQMSPAALERACGASLLMIARASQLDSIVRVEL